MYRIALHREVRERDSRHFDQKTKEKIKKRCIELLSVEPEKAGDPLQRELSGYRKLKVFDDYRVVYRVDRRNQVVTILVVGMRRSEEVYREAVKRIGKSLETEEN